MFRGTCIQYYTDGEVVKNVFRVLFTFEVIRREAGQEATVERAGEADVVSPLIMHGDTGFPHYDPPISIILHDESDSSYTSFVERMNRVLQGPKRTS